MINSYEVEFAKPINEFIKLGKEFQNTSANTDKWNNLKVEMGKLEKEIDGAIYKIYGLTGKEIKIIENEYGRKQ